MKPAPAASLTTKAIGVFFVVGAIDGGMEIFGHSLSQAQHLNLLIFGLGFLVVMLLNDIYKRIGDVLEELRGKDSR